MASIAPVRRAEDRPEDFLEDGHFWVREYVMGAVLRVRMAESGLLEWSDETGDFDADPPWPYPPAVTALRSSFDRDRFRATVEDVSAYEFSVLVPLSMGVAYDWERIPPVLGRAIRNCDAGSRAPVDVAERTFQELGLETVPTIDREIPARDLSIDGVAVPESAYGPERAAGVVLQKKRGEQVVVFGDGVEPRSRRPPEPRGIEAELETWLQESLDPDVLQSLLDSDEPLEARDMETLVDVVAGELARRRFDAVGEIARKQPAEYRTAVRGRLVAIRSQSTEYTN
jgi:hypothetical protein